VKGMGLSGGEGGDYANSGMVDPSQEGDVP